MIVKEQVSETLKTMPDEFEIDDLVERLIFLNKIDTGLVDIKNGLVFTQVETEERLKKWLK